MTAPPEVLPTHDDEPTGRALWRVPAYLRSERVRRGLCAACGSRAATTPITRAPRSEARRRRQRRRWGNSAHDPLTLPVLCVPCATLARANKTLRMRPPDKLLVFLRDGGRCAYCGRAHLWSDGSGDPDSGHHAWGIDHIVPRAAGVHGISNKTVACVTCGTRKADRTPEEWIADCNGDYSRLPPLLRVVAEQRAQDAA